MDTTMDHAIASLPDWTYRDSGDHRPPLAKSARARESGARRKRRLVSLLLGGIGEEVGAGSDLLRPIWAREAARRSVNLARLVHVLVSHGRTTHLSPIVDRIELALADDLASLYRFLATEPDRDIVACSMALREVVSNLAALFEYPTGVQLRTDIERLSLPAYKRRALVLAAGELVTRALLRGGRGGASQRLIVSLGMVDGRYARLIVADDSPVRGAAIVTHQQRSSSELADLLEGALIHSVHPWPATVAKITFPVRA